MSNRDFMRTLDTQHFAKILHALYVDGLIKREGPLTFIDMLMWLSEDCTKYQAFWNQVLT